MESKSAAEVAITSTTKLLSLELSRLMPLINDNPEFEAEDQAYLGAALEQLSLAKEAQKKDDYATAMKGIMRSVKRIGELVALRKEKNSDYAVLEAPFYLKQGSLLSSYLESKSDVFGNVPQLQVEDSEDESSEEPAEEEPGEGEPAQGEPAPEEEGEPKIEEEAPEKAEQEEDKEEEEKEPAQNQPEENPMMEDAIENLSAAIQLAEDFAAAASSPEKKRERMEVVSNLLIDAHSSLGDLFLFGEAVS